MFCVFLPDFINLRAASISSDHHLPTNLSSYTVLRSKSDQRSLAETKYLQLLQQCETIMTRWHPLTRANNVHYATKWRGLCDDFLNNVRQPPPNSPSDELPVEPRPWEKLRDEYIQITDKPPFTLSPDESKGWNELFDEYTKTADTSPCHSGSKNTPENFYYWAMYASRRSTVIWRIPANPFFLGSRTFVIRFGLVTHGTTVVSRRPIGRWLKSPTLSPVKP